MKDCLTFILVLNGFFFGIFLVAGVAYIDEVEVEDRKIFLLGGSLLTGAISLFFTFLLLPMWCESVCYRNISATYFKKVRYTPPRVELSQSLKEKAKELARNCASFLKKEGFYVSSYGTAFDYCTERCSFCNRLYGDARELAYRRAKEVERDCKNTLFSLFNPAVCGIPDLFLSKEKKEEIFQEKADFYCEKIARQFFNELIEEFHKTPAFRLLETTQISSIRTVKTR